ncbi:MAG: glycerophosphodiester phosphodiesterase [Gammaproteobacteria bacterium]|nr:glycerophosphodiester phosphodiesterase [Gammaproteobacteria bacterium]
MFMDTSFNIDAPLIIAHRGANVDAPENTLIAIELAAQQGATWIEVDLHLTADRRIIVIHDETLNRTTNGKGRVLDQSLAQLQQLDAGSWFANEFVGEQLPTLEQLIKLLDQFKLNVNLEIKADAGMEGETSEVTAKILQQHWPVNKSLPLISSFSTLALESMQHSAPHLPRGLLLEKWETNSAALATKLDCVTVNLSRHYVDAGSIDSIKALNKKIMIYTVNEPTQARELFNMGVDAIFTDCPGYMISAMQE